MDGRGTGEGLTRHPGTMLSMRYRAWQGTSVVIASKSDHARDYPRKVFPSLDAIALVIQIPSDFLEVLVIRLPGISAGFLAGDSLQITARGTGLGSQEAGFARWNDSTEQARLGASNRGGDDRFHGLQPSYLAKPMAGLAGAPSDAGACSALRGDSPALSHTLENLPR